MRERNGQVAVIRPVTIKVARPHRVIDVKQVVSHDEMVAQSARFAAAVSDARVLGEEDRQIRLTSIGLRAQQVEQIAQVSILMSDAEVGPER